MTGHTPDPITSRADLIAFAARLEGVPEVGFDTEFHSEQTYWPKVMLLQFSTPREFALVDPLAPEVKTSIGGFLELFKMRGQTLIGHALSYDLGIFMRLNGGLPARIFDTQVAAALVGHGGPIALSSLLEARLGVTIDKLYSRADWGKRPLPPAQVAYALDDVRHLHALADSLRSELEERGRLRWLEEETARSLDPKFFLPQRPADAWKRVGRKPAPGSRARRVLEEVAAERERIAQETDRPPRRILPDDVAVDLARRAPTEAQDLDVDGRRRPTPSLGKYADRWLDAIRAGLELSQQEVSPENSEPSIHARASADMGRMWAHWTLERQGVAPWLVEHLDERWGALVADLPQDREALRARLGLEGWRAELLVDPLWALLGERRPVRLVDADGSLRPEMDP